MHKFKCLIILGLVITNIWSAEPHYTYNWDKYPLLDQVLHSHHPVVWGTTVYMDPYRAFSIENIVYVYRDMIFGFKRLEAANNQLKQENVALKNKLTVIEAKLDLVLKMLTEDRQPGS